MVRSRDHDWRALQCRIWSKGLWWEDAKLASSLQEEPKRLSKQTRQETKSWIERKEQGHVLVSSQNNNRRTQNGGRKPEELLVN